MSAIPLKEQIAVISMGCLLPDAQSPDEFWQNILAKKISIGPSEPNRFDTEAHYRPEVYGKTQKHDKTYTNLASNPAEFEFDGRRFRLPPTVSQHMDGNQKIMVLSAEQALSQVNHDHWNRDKVSVFVGTSFIGELHHAYQRRTHWDRFSFHLKKHPDFISLDKQKQSSVLQDLEHRFLEGTHMISEDSAPGVLPNIIAARISSVFDFHGHAYTLDAACASTLAAIIAGVQHLNAGESDVVFCGGTDLLNAELGRIYFSGINALSPNGSFPFDARADGFVIGEGGGVFVLKRYSDAVRDNDTIWALISGYGQNSDGKGKAIAAPNSKWQARAIQDAIEMAGFSPHTIELIEAHGTSTKVGDKSEIDALKKSFDALGATEQHFCAVGSAKSNIGHLKAAAGVPGFMKAVMALHHKILPPTANCETVNSTLGIEGSPFYINTEAQPWSAKEIPRRAGVSAFGFGGANYHIALEEFRPEDVAQKLHIIEKRKKMVSPSLSQTSATDFSSKVVSEKSNTAADDKEPLAIFISGKTVSELQDELKRIRAMIVEMNFASHQLGDLVLKENFHADANDTHRLGISFSGTAELTTQLDLASKILEEPSSETTPSKWALLGSKGLFYKNTPPVQKNEIAFLFPGQASQYPDMCLELNHAYPQCRAFSVPMDQYWKENCGSTISNLISSSQRGAEATAAVLKNTRNTHPALLYGSVLCHEVLRQHGIEAGFMVGHSAGEITALKAAKILNLKNALKLMDFRSKSFVEMKSNQADGSIDFGKMAAVKSTVDSLTALIQQSGANVVLANLNSPKQLIVSGFTNEMDTFLKFLKQQNVRYVELKVSHAFHSPVVEPAAIQYRQNLESIAFQPAQTPVFANQTCETYPEEAERIRDTLFRQITGSVNFMGSIRKLAQKGVRLFVEVGPNQVLSQLTRAILEDPKVSVLSTNSQKKSDIEGIQTCLAGLFSEGVPLQYIPPQFSSTGTAKTRSLSSSMDSLFPPPVLSSVPKSKPKIVYSGVAVGLPGSFKHSFRDDNFDQLFEGRNFIEALSQEEKSRLVALQVSKVEKTEQGPVFHLLDSLGDVIQLAGKIGQIDALVDYQIDPREIEQMNQAIQHAVAAGYEALRDARIPLVHQYRQTSSGGFLPVRWAIPEEMQRRTGVIYAHGFPMVETVVAEVTRHLNHKFAGQGKQQQIKFYQKLLPLIQDAEAKEILTNWFIENQSTLRNTSSDNDIFRFNHLFINQISALANNRMAQYIQALGPNFQLNAACSSTCTAITLSQEMISSGRVDRMLVLASDDATSELSMPYLGAGFLSTGAASCEPDIYEAALPFDQRRNGMIMSAGATALVVERLDEVQRRGVRPVCELLGSHVFNSAGHHARLDVPRYATELKHFLSEMAHQHELDLSTLSKELLYISHETYTPARGGCSEAEAESLKHTFGENFRNILVTNTKGMTGHTMGASIEDVVAARALESGRVPPVVNFKVPDPKLAGLQLSHREKNHGKHQCRFALRMAAGFGSQGNYILLRKYGDATYDVSDQDPLDIHRDQRIEHPQLFLEWLRHVSVDQEVALELEGRLLRIKDSRAGTPANTASDKQQQGSAKAPKRAPLISKTSGTEKKSFFKNDVEQNGFPSSQSPTDPKEESSFNRSRIQELVFSVVSHITGYAPEMIEADMEIENDLGIDTVKQATILSTLGEKLGISEEFEFKIAAYPTIASWIDLFSEMNLGDNALHPPGAPSEPPTSADANNRVVPQAPLNTDAEAIPSSSAANTRTIHELVFSVVSEITGYAPEMIEADMEVENDLGIDTVKQATILSTLGERLGVSEEYEFQIATYPTIGSWIELFTALQEPVERPASVTETPSAAQSGTIEINTPLSETKKSVVRTEPANDTARNTDSPKRERALQCHYLIKEKRVIDSVCENNPLQEDSPKQLPENFPENLNNSRIFLIGNKMSQFEKAQEKLQYRCNELVFVDLSEGRYAATVESLKNQGFEALPGDIWLDLTPQFADVDTSAVLKAHFDFFKAMETTTDIQIIPKLVSYGPQSAAHGALIGFYQALAKEWKMDYCGIIDSSHHYLNIAFTKILHEVSHPSGCTVEEILDNETFAYRVMNQDEVSFETDIVGKPNLEKNLDWNSEDVLLVVGATGITGNVAVEFAKKFPSKVVLMGRTALSTEDYLCDDWKHELHTERKKEIHQQLQASMEKVRPIDVENAFAKILKQRELQQNIQSMRQSGTNVLYLRGDVSNPKSVKNVVEQIQRQWGNVSGILFGAGVEESAMLSKKTTDDFSRVVDPKIAGAQNIFRFAASESLKLWTCFSSISGVFGNAAQIDYSAANSFLNFFTLELQQRYPNLLVRSIAWSGWSDTGMAWRNSYVRENAEKIGLHLIPPTQGSPKAVELMTTCQGPAIQIVHKGLGHMLDNNWRANNSFPKPLLDRVEKTDKYRFHKTLDVRNDEWLNQHRLLDVPLLPGVGYLEMMAEIFCWKNDFGNGICYENLRFHDAFKLIDERPRELYVETDLDVDAKNSTGDNLTKKFNTPISMKIFSERKGRLFSELREYCCGEVSGVTAPAPKWNSVWEEPSWDEIADHFQVFAGIEKLPQNVIFGNLFHDFKREGADFDGMKYKWNREALMRDFGFPMEQLESAKYPLDKYEINFCLMDSLHQAGVVHTVLQTGKVHLPCGARRFVIYDKCDTPQRYKNFARCVGKSNNDFIYDIFLLDTQDNLCAAVYSCEFRKIS